MSPQVAGSDGGGCMARAGYVVAHDALPRYAFVYTVVFIVSIDKSVVSLHLCA